MSEESNNSNTPNSDENPTPPAVNNSSGGSSDAGKGKNDVSWVTVAISAFAAAVAALFVTSLTLTLADSGDEPPRMKEGMTSQYEGKMGKGEYKLKNFTGPCGKDKMGKERSQRGNPDVEGFTEQLPPNIQELLKNFNEQLEEGNGTTPPMPDREQRGGGGMGSPSQPNTTDPEAALKDLQEQFSELFENFSEQPQNVTPQRQGLGS